MHAEVRLRVAGRRTFNRTGTEFERTRVEGTCIMYALHQLTQHTLFT